MRHTWIVVSLLIFTIASATAYQRVSGWKEFHYTGSRLKADLAHPDALIRTFSLSRLPRDLLKVPIAHDVLTEDLVFYYEQHEDKLGLSGAIKRIAYEHNLDWSDRILASVFNESAEVALWRDGKGALRHYAIVMRRSVLSKVLLEAASVALKDSQLRRAGEIDIDSGKATVFALELNPRSTLLLVSWGDRIAVLSDPGLLFDSGNAVVPAARDAMAKWLSNEGVLARQFALDNTRLGTGAATHTIAIGAPTLTLGYGAFMPEFKGLRFDFGGSWSTSAWIDRKVLPVGNLGNAALWRAAPANPAACAILPVDWNAVKRTTTEADKKPARIDMVAAFDGGALACWYGESTLYTPVFVARLIRPLPQRNGALQSLADWAIASGGAIEKPTSRKGGNDMTIWRSSNDAAALGAYGNFIAFSPDGKLVDKVLDTIARTHPSVADQIPASDATLALMMPRPLSAMAEREILGALGGEDNLLAAAQTHLPARMQALATYPPYRLDLTVPNKDGWQRVEWHTAGAAK